MERFRLNWLNNMLEHIKQTVQKKATQLVGKSIKCRCGDNGVVILNQRRFYLQCTTCGYYGLLKTFNAPRTIESSQDDTDDLLDHKTS